jgi:tetratricopeptide (TPR) repeat protein
MKILFLLLSFQVFAADWRQDWDRAINQAINDQVDFAAFKKFPVGEDLINVTMGRIYYQKGNLDSAIKFYKKVPKTSDYFLQAQEELSWSYLRKGDAANALANVKGLLHPNLVVAAGPESLYLASLIFMKVCDYPRVADIIELFKKTYKTRAASLKNNKTLPYAINFDMEYKRLKGLKKNTDARVKYLAKEELGEIEEVLKKFYVIEAQLIQKLMLAKNVGTDTHAKKGASSQLGERVSDLRFTDDGEVWMDELNNYKVEIKKDCEAL